MANYNGQSVVGFYYNGKPLRYHPQVTLSTGGRVETVDGHFITADGLYFMTADNEEFITKESVNG